MLTKILITVLVIVVAMLYIRRPKEQNQSTRVNTKDLANNIKLKVAGYILIALSLTATAAYWYWDWSDGRQVVSVTIVSPASDESVVYQVRKKDITSNEITTINGIRIRLSNQERIIVANPVNE
ncbi:MULTISPECIES: hypothetical protein [Shewanella]|uniref:Uncharacterized protein n=1 Tax=Shewanella fidelis TaxID=173509 RepID=A0AAW8NNP4_9GAMM|nr:MULTISPECIES: hypothetical protein [Shewanella]MDR8523509.1 hypothetical protein [Shewanella fidelis]MDW4810056.1 hypothetical protein [Shewanella fidelis]MDW4814201.1 hypothetical protein [Shewanella fidelis]MDW4822232.1 hypothetical protein [Shewanella fidelis]MDW4826323.1 hypothetical protein [Shewanella fidelis]